MGKRTSVYLTDETAERVKQSSHTLAKLVELGLALADEHPEDLFYGTRQAVDYSDDPAMTGTKQRHSETAGSLCTPAMAMISGAARDNADAARAEQEETFTCPEDDDPFA
jgi:hypothetical protein